MSTIKVKVNGTLVEAKIEGNMRLLDLVRDTLQLKATKEGCSIGECGACTVIMNGNAVCSCLVLAAQCDDAEITTLEGLNSHPVTQKLQDAFVEKGGVQCGFCTPGVLVSATALIEKVPQPTDEQLKDVLEGNICRCTGYQPILDSIHHALKS
ncbi:MAG: (2Fe-2S)-binding protein [Yokenella regensburgei]|jgi:carbon-monoxide dehydrogenase small subunit|uniref:Carbon-monoxide dehydrogenase small subunit n=1 Tax=Yokenella regensburgei TaxID=158877 RepID=A0AB38FQ34_9ENTR|nr:(2Fe-2S)-binding protein [Yokenella regensburgei]EHM46992.1 putative carbon monoxide dehydrogenase, small subunit [Yokenella regensburgei ATCC 43003]KAF1371110.1 carbon-monoxide dehydrogenase small subunit [Yokenella regensburgei]KFD19335.1 xanthine dehydrogenase iron-sulfur subunit [Yokenella regensburgei ATCC 49455]MDQ4431510.1 (2Fe-2S)-binding protein [Yokenella regensburgei]MDR3104584.1 (2Fe-2S)-binding protein [Yokenella regensburgei]